MATTLLNPAGTAHWPSALLPHATTVPSLLSAKLCEYPAATAETLVKPDGIVFWLLPLNPQPTITAGLVATFTKITALVIEPAALLATT
jgi:hypothetical protein